MALIYAIRHRPINALSTIITLLNRLHDSGNTIEMIYIGHMIIPISTLSKVNNMIDSLSKSLHGDPICEYIRAWYMYLCMYDLYWNANRMGGNII
jgi:hypothetical protein